MEIKLTDRDRKLLQILSVVLLLFVFGYVIIYPLVGKYRTSCENVASAEEEKAVREEKVATLSTIRITKERLDKQFEKETEPYYDIMKSDEIDDLLTSLARSYHLTPRDLSISMPTDELKLGPYQFSAKALEEAKPQEPEQENTGVNASANAAEQAEAAGGAQNDTGETAAETDETVSTGLYGVHVIWTVSGDTDIEEDLIDDISLHYPSMRITSFEWTTKSYINGRDEYGNVLGMETVKALVIDLEIYMCEKEAE